MNKNKSNKILLIITITINIPLTLINIEEVNFNKIYTTDSIMEQGSKKFEVDQKKIDSLENR